MPKKKVDKNPESAKKIETATVNPISAQNNQLKFFLILMGVILLMVLAGIFIVNKIRNFEVDGVTFNVVKEQDLVFYQTSFPVTYGGELMTYNFYLRNDPRRLKEEIPFDGNILLRPNVVLDVTTEELFCDGDWNIAVGNLVKPLRILSKEVLTKNESIKYEPQNDYMFITINQGNKTEVTQIDNWNYEINVNNCEVLKGTERFMVKLFEKVNSEYL